MKTKLIVLLLVLVPVFGWTQNQTAVAENGKKVILKSDGTWKYVEEKSDSIVIESSDCNSLIKTTTDKMTGKSTTSANNSITLTEGGKTGLGIFLMKSSGGAIILTIQTVGAGSCIDEGSKINLLFDDGSRLELINDADFNCKGKATVYFGDVFGKTKQLAELQTKKISTMRVWTNDSYVEKDFPEDKKAQFFNVINCLTK